MSSAWFITDDSVIMNNNRYKIYGNSQHGLSMIRGRIYEVRNGILFYNKKIVAKSPRFIFSPKTRDVTMNDEMFVDIIKAVHAAGWEARETRCYDYYCGKNFHKGKRIFLIDNYNSHVEATFKGNNIMFEIKVAAFADPSIETDILLEFHLGPFMSFGTYDVEKKTVSFGDGRLPKNVSLKEFIEWATSLDYLKWPGMNLPFYAKIPSYYYEITHSGKVYGNVIYRDDSVAIVHDVNALYIATKDMYHVATVFALPVKFQPIKATRDLVKILLKDVTLDIRVSGTAGVLLENYEFAKEFYENIDIYNEFNIM